MVHSERNTLLSVVVPVHNEGENIVALVSEIQAALEGRLQYEIVYVDDGSTDETFKKLSSLTSNVPNLRVVRHDRRYGQSAAIWTGIKHANGEWIATLDGDGQNDPHDIVRIIECRGGLQRLNSKLVFCGHRKIRHDVWSKKASSRIANLIRRLLLKDRTPDTGCGLKIFHRELFLSLPFFDHMHRFLPALFLSVGAEVESVEVAHRPRRTGTTHYGIRDRLFAGIFDLFGVMWLRKRIKMPVTKEENIET